MSQSTFRLTGPKSQPSPRRLSGRALTGCLCLGLSFGALGCGPAAQPEPTTRPSEDVQRRLVELEQRAIMGEVESRRLRAEVDRLEKDLREAREQAKRTAPAARPSAPIGDGVGTITLNPVLESADLEEPQVPAPATGSTPQTIHDTVAVDPAAITGTPVPLTGTSAQQIYDQGYSLFHQRRYSEAEYVFGQALVRHPEHDLADNALFWIGESRYARGDYEAALNAFTATLERYPDGNKVGDAMLKAGKSLEALGRPEGARETYRELRRLFPDSAAAIVAEERLKALP